MVSIKDSTHQFVEVNFELTICGRTSFFGSDFCLFVVVFLLDEGGKEEDVGLCPGGFSLKKIVDLTLARGTGGYGSLVRDFSFSDFPLDVI